jgi:hypothetical protein
MSFNKLPLEIQISILRNYDKSLWIASRSLNKLIRNATEIEFIKYEFQYPVKISEIYEFTKSKPESFIIFDNFLNCEEKYVYSGNIFKLNKNNIYTLVDYYESCTYSKHSYSYRDNTNSIYLDIFLNEFKFTPYSVYNCDIKMLYKILTNRHSSKLAIKVIIDTFNNKTMKNFNRNDINNVNEIFVWLIMNCIILGIEVDYKLDKNNVKLAELLKIIDNLIPKVKEYLLNIDTLTR